jgi:hypothetical protein
MKDMMEDIDEPLEDEDVNEDDDDLDELEPPEEALADAPATPAPDPASEAEVESIEDLLVKKEAQAEEEAAEEEDESLVSLPRKERLEPLAVKVVPPQASEFVCQNCYLVKHRSQLKDKKRMLCRDCA